MSNGERSCKMFGNCLHEEEKCTVDCNYYNPLPDVKPDTLSEKTPEQIQKGNEEIKKPILQFSTLKKFDKVCEFVILKNNVFQIQSISPKKIILKFKRKITDKKGLPDGCYTIRNPENDELYKISNLVFNSFKNKQ